MTSNMDLLAILGVIIGFAAIVGGNSLEGGQLAALLDLPAGIIVFGGTLGAVFLRTPLKHLYRAASMLRWIVLPPRVDSAAIARRLVEWSRSSRRHGLLALENAVYSESDAFTKKALALLVDGSEHLAIRRTLETDLNARMDFDLAAARVFRSMGGFAPTIGIIGAVLGLIQVMGHLAEPSELGRGIATAFVATIYGVGSANLLFLPIADRIQTLVIETGDIRALTVEGIVAIADGDHPKAIETRLSGYLQRFS